MSYAKGTDVPVSRSRDEIERTLRRYGAEAFGYAGDGTTAMVEFTTLDRRVRLFIPMPEGRLTAVQYDREVRRRWRVLLLTVKAKLEAIESGISTFDDEFLAHLVLPTGRTVGEWLLPQLDRGAGVPELLPGRA